tara:strand:+ start:461 stop:781 length:321 start_codon:yes stop_codon:yes gene_type:complete
MSCPFIDEATNKTLGRLLHCHELIRAYGIEMSATPASIFLYIAANNGCYKREMEIDLDLPSATSTQNIQRLVARGFVRKDYIGNLMCLELTDNGERLVNRLEMVIR